MNDGSGPAEPQPPAPSPSPDPSPSSRDQADRDARVLALAGYLQANRDAFTEDALRRTAADAGYDAREIDAAWAVSAEPIRGRRATGRAILIAFGYFFGVFVVATLLSLFPDTSILALPAIGLGLALGVFAWLSLRDSNPPLAEAFRIGVIVLVVLPLVLGLVAFGVCMVALVGFAR